MKTAVMFQHGDIVDLAQYTDEFTSPQGMITGVAFIQPARSNGVEYHEFSGSFIAKEATGNFCLQVAYQNAFCKSIQVTFFDVEYVNV